MKRLLVVTVGVLLASIGAYIFGCGETDPAMAPAGSTITLVGYDAEETVTFACDDTWNVPNSCYNSFREACIENCALSIQDGEGSQVAIDTYQSCVETTGIGSEGDCSAYVCDTLSYWLTYCEMPKNKLQAQNTLRAKEGSCGYQYWLVSALVQAATSTSTSSASTGGSSSASTGSVPMNDIEVRWVTTGGDLYKPEDVPGAVAPLANPYYDRTDDRGISEVKYRIPNPNVCGAEMTYQLSADVGTAVAGVKFTITAGESTSTDDDTESADDDTATK